MNVNNDKPSYLYHGSQYLLDVIKPHTASGLSEERGTEYGIYAYEDMLRVICIKTISN